MHNNPMQLPSVECPTSPGPSENYEQPNPGSITAGRGRHTAARRLRTLCSRPMTTASSASRNAEVTDTGTDSRPLRGLIRHTRYI